MPSALREAPTDGIRKELVNEIVNRFWDSLRGLSTPGGVRVEKTFGVVGEKGIETPMTDSQKGLKLFNDIEKEVAEKGLTIEERVDVYIGLFAKFLENRKLRHFSHEFQSAFVGKVTSALDPYAIFLERHSEWERVLML